MAKGQNTRKGSNKKKAVKTLKEKRQEKKDKKNQKRDASFFD